MTERFTNGRTVSEFYPRRVYLFVILKVLCYNETE